MGCDIHSLALDGSGAIVKGSWVDGEEPFGWRSYHIFGFLAGVRNYSGVPAISPPRGLPEGFEEGDHYLGDHSQSWLSVSELLAFDYDGTCEPGNGVTMTWKEFLGEDFFKDLEELRVRGADKIVFGFDS